MLQPDQASLLILELLSRSNDYDCISMDDIVNDSEIFDIMSKRYQYVMTKHYVYINVSNDLENIMNYFVYEQLAFEYQADAEWMPTDRYFKISPQGRAYLRNIEKEKYRYLYPLVISIIALVFSVLLMLKVV